MIDERAEAFRGPPGDCARVMGQKAQSVPRCAVASMGRAAPLGRMRHQGEQEAWHPVPPITGPVPAVGVKRGRGEVDTGLLRRTYFDLLAPREAFWC